MRAPRRSQCNRHSVRVRRPPFTSGNGQVDLALPHRATPPPATIYAPAYMAHPARIGPVVPFSRGNGQMDVALQNRGDGTDYPAAGDQPVSNKEMGHETAT